MNGIGEELTVTNLTIADFDSGVAETKTFSTYAETTGNEDMIAGEYMGTVMFNIHCD